MKRFRLVNMTLQPAGNCKPGVAFPVFYTLNLKLSLAIKLLAIITALLVSVSLNAQQYPAPSTDTAFVRVIAERTAKIVNSLNIKDAAAYKKVHQQLIDQYLQLNAIQDGSKAAIADIKAKQLEKTAAEEAVKKEEERKTTILKQLHQAFIAQLKVSLTEEQLEQVKNGMTYSVLPVTWKAYLEMIPRLTQEQKDKMYAWLLEARELAMDEGSSDKKHAVFGKYKGRINNYLSAAGYDMKKEGEEWAKRIEAAKEPNQTQN